MFDLETHPTYVSFIARHETEYDSDGVELTLYPKDGTSFILGYGFDIEEAAQIALAETAERYGQ